jgi:hypothetical protein
MKRPATGVAQARAASRRMSLRVPFCEAGRDEAEAASSGLIGAWRNPVAFGEIAAALELRSGASQ